MPEQAAGGIEADVVEETYLALLSVGHSELDARVKIDQVLTSGKKFKTAQEILQAIYQQG